MHRQHLLENSGVVELPSCCHGNQHGGVGGGIRPHVGEADVSGHIGDAGVMVHDVVDEEAEPVKAAQDGEVERVGTAHMITGTDSEDGLGNVVRTHTSLKTCKQHSAI